MELKKSDCTIYLEKTKALISCVVTVQLFCAFAFAYARSRVSHDVVNIEVCDKKLFSLNYRRHPIFLGRPHVD